jgi:hypothetical protein
MDADNRRRGRVLVSTHSHPALAQQELQAGVDDETVEQLKEESLFHKTLNWLISP